MKKKLLSLLSLLILLVSNTGVRAQSVSFGSGHSTTGYISDSKLVSGTAHLDVSAKTLTLTNAVINSGIYVSGFDELTINLVGQNVVTSTSYILNLSPAEAGCDYTIQGSGSLKGTTTDAIGVYFANYTRSGSLTIKDCQLDITAWRYAILSSSNGSSYPPQCDLVIDNAAVAARVTGTEWYCGGILCFKSITLQGGAKVQSPSNTALIACNGAEYGYWDDGRDDTATKDIIILPDAKAAEKHSVTVESVAHGTASASVSTAKYGDVITLTATPDDGYVLTGYTLSSGSIDTGGTWYNTTATVVMPYGDLVVTPVFSSDLSDLSINMPRDQSTVTMNIPSYVAHFSMYDENGYADWGRGSAMGDAYRDGTIVVNAVTGKKVQVTGSLKMWSGSLNLYDGDSTAATSMGSFCPGDYNQGFQPIGTYVSSSNVMTFMFDPRNNYADMRLAIDLVDANTDFSLSGLGSLTGGTLAASVGGSAATTAKVGQTVTLTATPAAGYRLASITAVDAAGNSHPVSGATFNNPVGTLTMPGSNVTLTATFTNDLTAAGGLYVNLPASGLLTLDASDLEGVTSFNVYDDGGKDGLHKINCQSQLLVAPASGKLVMLEGTISFKDYKEKIQIYDGTSSSDTKLYEASISGTETIPVYTSTENAMFINFSSGTYSSAPGLELVVSIVDKVPHSVTVATVTGGTATTDVASALPGATVTITAAPSPGYKLVGYTVVDELGNSANVEGGLFYAPTGTFVMPNSNVTVTPIFTNNLTAAGGLYVNMPFQSTLHLDAEALSGVISFKVYDNGGSTDDYKNSSSDYLKLTAPTGKGLQIQGTVTSETGYDYLSVYSGLDKSSPAVGNSKYGTNEGEDVGTLTTGQNALLYFSSDGGVVRVGLDLTVTLYDLAVFSITVNQAAGGTVTAPASAFQSETVVLTVTPDKGKYLSGFTLNGETVSLNLFESATFVMPSANVTIVPVFSDLPSPIVLNIPSSGTRNVTIPAGITSIKVQDENGDMDYGNSYSGYLTMTVPEGYKINIEGTCVTEGTSWDYMIIYDGASSSSPILGKAKYGGTSGEYTLVSDLTTTGNVVTFYFRSDGSNVDAGPDLTVTLKPAVTPGDVNEDGSVTIADVTALVNIILGKGSENDAADVNDDGVVTIADVTALVNLILGK